MNNTNTLPVGQKCTLAKTPGNSTVVRPTPVEIVSLIGEGRWMLGMDGGQYLSRACYVVRELATGVEYSASEKDLRPYQPTPKAKPVLRRTQRFVSLALML